MLTALSSPRGSFIYGRGVGFDLAYGPHIVNKESALWIGVDPHSIKSSGGSRSMVWAKLRQSFVDLKFFLQNERAVASGNARELSISYPKLVALKAFVNSDDPLVIEANRLSDIKNVVEFKAFLNKLGFKKTVIISGGSESWLYADKLAAAKIPVMFTPTNQTPLSFDTIQSRDDIGAVLEKAGVDTIIVPTRDFSPRLRQEAAIAVSYGMSEQAALSSITSTPARYFSLAKQTSLNEGQFANLVIWESSPLNLRKAPTMMIIKGKYTGLENRQKTLAKKYLN